HWRERLRGLRPLDLPTDRPRTNVSRAFEGARARRRLPSSVLELARQVAREHGVTLYATLLAAFNALMHRYTGAEDVGVASPVTGRGTPELEGLVGYFPNLLVMRTPVDPAQSFAALLRATRTTVLDAFEHQEVPLEAVVAEGVASVTPVCFTMQGEATATPPLGAARTSAELTDFGTAKFDLLFGAGERDGGLLVGVEYRVDLFDAATAERMLDHFATLLEAALRSPETAVSRLPILPAEERAQVLDRWNATARDYPQHATLVSLLAEQVARTPNAVAVSDERRVLTYAELDARATALAHRLRAQGAGRGVLVGVCAERSVELVIALVAVLRAGAAYVPLDPEYPRDRLAFMLDDAAVPVLLATRDLATRLATRAPLIALDDVADTAPLSGDLGALPAPLPGDPAYMIYTSGSTGRPKGAVNAHRGIVNRLLWMQEEYALGSQDAVLQKTPFSFDVSVWELFWPLLAGARLVMARAGGHRDPAYLADVITRERITVCHFVPSMLRAFLAGAEVGACGSLRDVMASGEALAPDLVAAFNGIVPNARLHNLYGPTECAVDVTYWPCPRTSEPLRVVPIGRPVANTRMYVLDRAGEPTPIGVAGELHIAGVQVGLGYHGRPELTAERFPRDPFATGLTSSDASDARLYRTGDLARWRADGTIEYLGRLDFQVKVRGFRIELGEIEATLSRHAQVAAVVVVAPEDGSGTPRLVAYVVPRAPFSEAHSTEALWTSLRALAAESLPDHMVPNVFVALDTLPLTPSGKVDRKALPVPSVDMRRRDYVAPRTPSEVALARIWSEVLTLDKVGATHGFLELGGHSLAAMRVVARVRGDTNVVLPLAPLLRGDTLQQVAELLDAARRSQDDANAAAPDTEDEFALAPVARSAFRRAGRSGAGGPS
ncbi:MAG TPA: amino acid adenylation domain-containing protein, partial [Gemmatimonadaceae bacterium]